ncbi:hypothetical protein NIES2119_08070 [[Phormidium ambiguum] IAM M-71]|uniref:Uncharacterized protein n=1 Tax=[Phormidium ambiguum] IAM M-71 TaxID=454136 RepID=A0A1U7IP42_9CYAN|nr:hypothetical protein [Phormidium ambiguum]OKH39076.1 hypothetical protein NIES2119_08070 [Phormidium ambiguum IAM M-71]
MEYPQIMKRFRKIIDRNAGTTEQIFSPLPLSYNKYTLDPSWTSLERRLTNLNLEVRFFDLPSTDFPEALTTEFKTEWDENLILRDNEWKSPNRILAEFVERDSSSDPWQRVGEISIVNRGNIPYPHPGFLRAVKALGSELFLGDSQDIAIRCRDIGAGVIRGADQLIITGLYVERAFIPDEGKNIINLENHAWSVSPSGTLLFTATANMAFFRIYNNGNNRVWINYGQFDGVGMGDPLQAGEGREWLNKPSNEYKLIGDIWVVAEGNTNQQLSGVIGYR